MDHLVNDRRLSPSLNQRLIMDLPITKPKLLIVDDDEDIRAQMKWALSQAYEVFLAEDKPSANDMWFSKLPFTR